MRADTEEWVGTCQACASKKGTPNYAKPPLDPMPLAGFLCRWAIDVMGPLPLSRNGNRFIIVLSEYHTRFPEAFATPDAKAETVAKLVMEQIVCRYGCPLELLSDRGTNFLSALVAELCRLCDTRKLNTSSWHPQTDGLVERFNATLINILSMYTDSKQDDWDSFIPYALFSYRTARQESLKETPFHLMYGADARLPIDAAFQTYRSKYNPDPDAFMDLVPIWLTESREFAQQELGKAQKRQKSIYDRKVKIRDFQKGQLVYLYTPVATKGQSRKLLHPWHGPFEVIDISSPNLKLRDPSKPKTDPKWIHMSRVKQCHSKMRILEKPAKPVGSFGKVQSDTPEQGSKEKPYTE